MVELHAMFLRNCQSKTLAEGLHSIWRFVGRLYGKGVNPRSRGTAGALGAPTSTLSVAGLEAISCSKRRPICTLLELARPVSVESNDVAVCEVSMQECLEFTLV